MDRASALEQPVRQRRFAVIDVRDNAEVARKLDSHGSGHYAGASTRGQLVHTGCQPKSQRNWSTAQSGIDVCRCQRRLLSVEIVAISVWKLVLGIAAGQRTARTKQSRTANGRQLPLNC